MLREVTPISDTITARRELRLLIIDDDRIVRETYLRFLNGDCKHNYRVVEADSAEAGAALLAEAPFDCVVLDYQLPGANGLTVLRSLRDGGFAAMESPVVMMTGQGSEVVAVAAMKLGVADYLS